MNINRGVVLLIWNTHSHLCSALVEREKQLEKEEDQDLISLLVLPFWGIYIKEAFTRFFPLGFSQDKSMLFL